MKKSVKLFILWAVVVCGLTVYYLGVMRYSMLGNYDGVTFWVNILPVIALICSAVMLPLVRRQAKNDHLTWLAVVSKVALIVYSALAAGSVMIFLLGQLLS